MPVTTERIEASYRYADGVTGGYAQELWLVKGVDSLQAISDFAVGLPRVGEPHSVNSLLRVRERIIETIVDPQTTIVRIDYRQASFDIGTIYSTSESFSEPEPLHLIWILEEATDSEAYTLMKGGQWDVFIYPTIRRYTVNAGGDLDAVMAAIINNKNKRYLFSFFGTPFTLINGQVRKLKNGQVIADYFFKTHNGFASIPLGTFPNMYSAVPACPPGGMVFTSKAQVQSGGGAYTIKTANELYQVGTALPGM
jgi:hypothetical protein